MFLALLGGLAARAGGAGVDGRGLAGHVLWGPGDGLTAGVGSLFGRVS